MTERIHIPLQLIDGPGRVYFAMKVGTFYTIAELEEATSLGKSTINRYVKRLTDEGILKVFRGDNTRGRPLHYYTVATKEGTKTP